MNVWHPYTEGDRRMYWSFYCGWQLYAHADNNTWFVRNKKTPEDQRAWAAKGAEDTFAAAKIAAEKWASEHRHS